MEKETISLKGLGLRTIRRIGMGLGRGSCAESCHAVDLDKKKECVFKAELIYNLI